MLLAARGAHGEIDRNQGASMRVIVIGAGISGVTTAYMLSRAGCQVTVVDRAAGVADETSFANGGVVSVPVCVSPPT